jgi:type IV pilus assembly protein PilA
MFQRFHEMKERREGGFTLIELLVVILIIAILAAIAIPVFLAQRRKGWIAQVESTLKNAATAQESFLTEPTSTAYADVVTPDLTGQGFKLTSDIVMTDADVVVNGGLGYCMKATSAKDSTIVRYYSSKDGRPVAAAPAAGDGAPACP